MFVVVFTDYTDVVDVVGLFETHEAAHHWALNSERCDETWTVKEVTK